MSGQDAAPDPFPNRARADSDPISGLCRCQPRREPMVELGRNPFANQQGDERADLLDQYRCDAVAHTDSRSEVNRAACVARVRERLRAVLVDALWLPSPRCSTG
jgi:hypothetical protein